MAERPEWWTLMQAVGWIARREAPTAREPVEDEHGRPLDDIGHLPADLEVDELERAQDQLLRAVKAGSVTLRGRGPWAMRPDANPDVRYGEHAAKWVQQDGIPPKAFTTLGLALRIACNSVGPDDRHRDLLVCPRWNDVQVSAAALRAAFPPEQDVHRWMRGWAEEFVRARGRPPLRDKEAVHAAQKMGSSVKAAREAYARLPANLKQAARKPRQTAR